MPVSNKMGGSLKRSLGMASRPVGNVACRHLLASFGILLEWPQGGKGRVKCSIDPFEYFDKHGAELVRDIVEQSEELGNNPNATGKSRMLWSGLRTKVENRLLKFKHEGGA